MFSGGIERDQWHEIGKKKRGFFSKTSEANDNLFLFVFCHCVSFGVCIYIQYFDAVIMKIKSSWKDYVP